MTIETTCPYCHQPRSAHPDTPSFQSHDTEIAYIENETRRLDQLSAQIQEQRIALLRRLNYIRSPPSKLPPEALSLIFNTVTSLHDQVICEEDGTRSKVTHPIFVLGAVSSHWRTIIYSTPHFWASADFKIYPRQERSLARILRIFLENSANVPISLNLHFIDSDIADDTLVHSTVDDLILKTLPRITNLQLINPSLKWRSALGQLSQLTNFSLESARLVVFAHFSLPNSPSLRRLFIKYKSAPVVMQIDFSWDKLTSLELHRIPFNTCVDLLVRCSSLVEFTWREFAMDEEEEDLYNQQHPPPPLLEPITHERLQTFIWPGCNHYRKLTCRLLRSLRLPSLQTLGWTDRHDEGQAEFADVQLFLGNLPPTVSTLILLDYGALDQATSRLPNIKHLILDSLEYDGEVGALGRLGQSGGSGRVLPSLSKLTIRSKLYHQGSRFSVGIANMLVGRMNEPDTAHLCVEVFTPVSMNWEDETKERLKGLVNNGCKLEIIQNSKHVDWLE